jgi:hypothetical protein
MTQAISQATTLELLTEMETEMNRLGNQLRHDGKTRILLHSVELGMPGKSSIEWFWSLREHMWLSWKLSSAVQLFYRGLVWFEGAGPILDSSGKKQTPRCIFLSVSEE